MWQQALPNILLKAGDRRYTGSSGFSVVNRHTLQPACQIAGRTTLVDYSACARILHSTQAQNARGRSFISKIPCRLT